MKKLVPLSIFIVAVLLSCGSDSTEDSSETSSENDTTQTEESLVNEHFLSVEEWDTIAWDSQVFDLKEYYIISYAGVEKEEDAIAMVDSLKPKFENAGYLWIPDFASLSGKEMYAVFLDQSAYDFSILSSLQEKKVDNPGIYVVRVNQDEDRWEAYSPIDIRINKVRQKMILTYATPEDSEEYAEDGGEDWGWFVNDVSSYFADNHPEILFGSVYGDDLLPNEIQVFEDEFDLGVGSGFGYIFMDGNEMGFIGHDMPEYVISEACAFFGFDPPDGQMGM